MSAPLHNDDPDATELIVTGAGTGHHEVRTLRNLTAEEYAATYADGTPHYLPAGVEADLEQEAAQIAAARKG